MRLGSLLMTVIGLGIAGGAVQLAQTQLRADRANAAADSIVRVIAAAQDIPFGVEIENHMLTSIEWPIGSVPSGAFTDYADVLPLQNGEPRRSKRALSQGELLLISKVSDYGEKVTIVQTLTGNHRAMAINVDAQSGVGGFVTPGDFVDVVLTRGRDLELKTVTILQKVRVIGVDQTADEQSDQPGVARTVTVEVSAVQGQKLALAQQAGKLSLSLRSFSSDVDTPLAAIDLTDIMLDESPVDDGSKARQTVRVRRAATSVEEVPVK